MPRKSRCRFALIAAMTAAGLAAAGAASADVRYPNMQGGGTVNVNVNFNSQLPLADMSDETLAAVQKRGRVFVYNMASEECENLLATIAESCRLTSLSVSAQVRNQNNNKPNFVYLNGSARYMITLKPEGGAPAPATKP
ncbi:MAG TPA: hypothetical protein VLN73_03805 [Alphaproteobacteria bacterium]|nr:hypothetical protein [Alphaproteobacteria bacterium]